MSSTCNPDIIMTLERKTQDYLGVYGEVTFVAVNKDVAKKCGSKHFLTIELPAGNYELTQGRGKHQYPYQQSGVCIKHPLETGGKKTSPSSLATTFGADNPSNPGAAQADYDKALDSSLRISKGSDNEGDQVFCHSGRTSMDSWLCPLVGNNYIQTVTPLIYLYPPQPPPPPGIQVGMKYSFMSSFTAADSLSAQLEMNLWFIKVEKELKRPPDMKYQSKGPAFVQAVGPLPQPIP